MYFTFQKIFHSIIHCLKYSYNCGTGVNYMSNTTGVLLKAGNAYTSRAPWFTAVFPSLFWFVFGFFVLVFCGVRIAHLFIFLCRIFCFACLRSVSCVPQCWQCLWIVHSLLHLRFSLTFIFYLFMVCKWSYMKKLKQAYKLYFISDIHRMIIRQDNVLGF
jgi:hypothetical protein